ncbi:MAG: aromatic ring-hydroxylating dioxygenase subunit alpha, partial [Oceanospirillaceae bacterium]
PSLPAQCYSSPEILEREKQRLFLKSWIAVGRADQWPNAGDYSTRNILDIPIILIKDKHGNIKAYSNSCRHRGAKLLEGSGNCRTICCPFHCWTYDLEGNLVFAPKIKNDETFNYDEYGLIEIQSEARDGFVYINFTDSASDTSGSGSDSQSIDTWLGEFPSVHAPWKFKELVSYKRHEFTVNCNWKAFLDVFNEYYHLPYIHPSTINEAYKEPEAARLMQGNFSSQFGSTEGSGGLLEETQQYTLPATNGMDDKTSNGVRYTWVYPNLTFAASAEAVWIYEALPITAQTSQIALTLCFPQSSTELEDFETRADFYYQRLIAAINEDIPALENQQLGLNSPLAKQGRYHERLEPNVAHFDFWYAGLMGKS